MCVPAVFSEEMVVFSPGTGLLLHLLLSFPGWKQGLEEQPPFAALCCAASVIHPEHITGLSRSCALDTCFLFQVFEEVSWSLALTDRLKGDHSLSSTIMLSKTCSVKISISCS